MKTRIVILAIITLVIGFVLGMLTSAQRRLNRLKPVRMYFSEQRFRDGFYKIIQPDENQKIKIDQILDKYAQINIESQNNFRKEFENNRKAMRKELDSNLTKEQIARIKEMDERRQEMMKQERERHKNDTTRFNGNRDQSRKPPENGHGFQGPPPPFPEDDGPADSTGIK